MTFEFATAGRIVFGRGQFEDAGRLARGLGTRALVVTGRSPERGDRLARLLEREQITVMRLLVSHEPTVETVRGGVRVARTAGCDLVLAVGGGSAIDAGKAIAAIATNDGDVSDYLEVVGRGQPLVHSSLPFVAIPTTAGTGSEVTRNAVLTSPEHRVKASLRSPLMLPRVALIDPDLTLTVPPENHGRDRPGRADATHRGLCLATGQCRDQSALGRGHPARRRRATRVVRDGGDCDAREAMALASLYSGLALSSAGLGAVHALAGPLGGIFGAPHGALCGALLPHVLGANVRALEARAPDHPALVRFQEVARLLTGDASARAEGGIAWLRGLEQDVRIPPLGTYGLAVDDFPEVIAHAARANSMKSNPVDLTADELAQVLSAAM